MMRLNRARPQLKQLWRAGGFTLTELLVVIAILAVMAVILVGILNPIMLINKARDAARKKDLDTIKKSFEEYFNDKGKYPTSVGNWNIKSNCKKKVSAFTYLNSWPCDPNGEPYNVIVDVSGKWFKILTDLENKKDDDIPVGWYTDGSLYTYGVDVDTTNYGVSSPNIKWYEKTLNPLCDLDVCVIKNESGCNSSRINGGSVGCITQGNDQCYVNNNCNDACKVDCCGAGCN